MEPNQVNLSPENWWIPQGIPTWVFVPNNQSVPVQETVQPAVVASPEGTPVVKPVTSTEGPLDKFFKRIIRFIARITGQPDPITGAPNIASQVIQKWENIVGKARNVANQVVEKTTDVTGKAVDIATNVATQAAQQVQQIIPPPPTSEPTQQTPQIPQASQTPTTFSK